LDTQAGLDGTTEGCFGGVFGGRKTRKNKIFGLLREEGVKKNTKNLQFY